jgi:transcriptional regulator with XRE-family HTH domain
MQDEEKFLVKVGKNIAKLRKKRKLSQTALGNMMDLDKQHISRFELGHNITIKTLYRLSNALETPVHKILQFEED